MYKTMTHRLIGCSGTPDLRSSYTRRICRDTVLVTVSGLHSLMVIH